jgi:hypothetical protein
MPWQESQYGSNSESELYCTTQAAMETAMEMTIRTAEPSLAPNRFVSEVDEFRETIADPSLTLDEKKRAYGLIVKHAALLDPEDAGFWRAGVALKVALCAWLDFRPTLEH